MKLTSIYIHKNRAKKFVKYDRRMKHTDLLVEGGVRGNNLCMHLWLFDE